MSEQQAEYVVTLYDRVAHDRTWNNVGFGIADQIDRAMCAAEGIAALQRAVDLATLAEVAKYGYVVMGEDREAFFIEIKHKRDWKRFRGPDAIAEAAAWVRQRGGA
jgi:hypothetical protein